MPFAQAMPAVLAAFKKAGRVQSVQEKFGRIVGEIGSGIFNMNRANVIVQVQPDGESQCKLVVAATDQEGLISQDTAAKANSQLLEAV